jgi:uncharacterized protein YegL
MMKKNVELVFILDRSGSMGGLEKDTINGFNKMVKKQKKHDGDAFVTTVLFDDDYELLHDRMNLQDMKPLTNRDYFVRGCTALLDAVGKTIQGVKKEYKACAGEKPHVIFVIITDGLENASREYAADQIRKMILKQKKKHGWEFIFLGANMDAVAEATSMGISEDMAANFEADSKGILKNYQVVEELVCDLRESGVVKQDWKRDIEEG